MERRRIIINFKNTPEDIALYESLKNHSSISGYIKDLLKGMPNEKGICMTQMPVNFVFNDEDVNA
jgi:hypothetical protein